MRTHLTAELMQDLLVLNLHPHCRVCPWAVILKPLLSTQERGCVHVKVWHVLGVLLTRVELSLSHLERSQLLFRAGLDWVESLGIVHLLNGVESLLRGCGAVLEAVFLVKYSS